MSEAQYSTVSHAVSRYQKPLNYTSPVAWTMCVCVSVNVRSFTCASVYVIFVALPLLLQARLIFQWATKIYCRSLQGISEEKPECSAGLSEHDSDWLVCSNITSFIISIYMNEQKAKWLMMNTMQWAAWKPRPRFDLWWGQALCLAQTYCVTLMIVQEQ